MPHKIKYSPATLRALKKMSQDGLDVHARPFSYEGPKIHVTFQTSGVTVHNTWSISDINKMSEIND